jgi:hypothetical protein
MMRRLTLLLAALLTLVLLAGCGSRTIYLNYPGEELDFQLPDMQSPAVYMDTVTDMRPPVQRTGRGHFLGIDYPNDGAWERPVSELYAEALAEDVSQTNLVQLVPLRGQADYVLSADILSLGCRFERNGTSFLLPFLVGGAAGFALGDDTSHSLKLGTALGLVSVMAIPMPSKNYAEVEIRMTLANRQGDVIWQKSCLGEYEDKVRATATSRHDQKYVDQHLTRAIKRANGCLLGQMRQFLIEQGEPAAGP